MKTITLSNQEHKDLIEILNDTDDSRVTSIINKLQLPQPTGLREAALDKLLSFTWDQAIHGAITYREFRKRYKIKIAALANEKGE
jgi:hypothetical protein